MTAVTKRRSAAPTSSRAPPVVFVHGFLVDNRLWGGVADRLAAQGVRCYLVDWPLGSHRTPMAPDADLSPAGVARMIDDVLTALDLDDVDGPVRIVWGTADRCFTVATPASGEPADRLRVERRSMPRHHRSWRRRQWQTIDRTA